MHSNVSRVAVFLASLMILSFLGSSALDIQTYDGDLDVNWVSPDSEVAQVVKVVDGTGEMVNESILLNESGNEFQFEYNGNSENYSSMTHLSDGYYYAFFETGPSGGLIDYRIVDQSAGAGTTTEYETLWNAPLSMDLQDNYTSRLQAGETIDIAVNAQNLANYQYVDEDNDEEVSGSDVLVADVGGEGTYSSRSDEVLVGSSPDISASVSNNNPWRNSEHSVAMNDSRLGGDWSPGSDIIILDYNSGGTVSTQKDDALNTGHNSDVNAEAGLELKPMSDISSDKYFASEDEKFDEGEITVFDNDSDGNYTSQPDNVLAGKSDYAIETSVTYSGNVPSFMEIASYDSNTDGGTWDSNQDVIVHNRDKDSMFTRQEDRVLSGTEPSEAANLSTSHIDEWNNENPSSANSGDLDVIDRVDDGGAWNATEDGMWIEDGASPGYQSSEDTLVVGNPPSGTQPDTNGDLFSRWSEISVYDNAPGNNFSEANDAIIMDYNEGGTYSKNEDVIIAGTPSGFSAGSTFTNSEGFAGDWNMAMIDGIEDNGGWSSDVDTILVDRNDGGTYSPYPDTIINSGDSTGDGGTALRALSSISSEKIMWADINENGVYDAGDEIFRDRDKDGIYTNRSDKHLAGLSLEVAGEGTGLSTTNLWQRTPYDNTPILFANDIDNDFDEESDVIFHDLDMDGRYTSRRDTVIDGDTSIIENGDPLVNADVNTSQLDPNIKALVTTGSQTSGPIELGTNEEGVYVGELQIPDLHGQKMLLQITAETSALEYGSMISEEISTRPQGIGFSLGTNQITLEVDKKGQYDTTIGVENLLEDSNTLNLNASDGISNMTELDSQIELDASGTGELNASFTILEMEDKEGEITLTEEESGISDTVDVEVKTPQCSSSTENLCRTDSGPIEITADERDNFTANIELLNIGQRGSERDVEIDVEGNISDFVEVDNGTSFEDTSSVEVGFSPMRPGNYSGELVVTSEEDEISVPLRLHANFIELETQFEITPQEIELGAVPTGQDKDVQNIEIDNTGTVEINNITFDSSSYSIAQTNPGEISSSETQNYTLTFESVESVGSSIDVTAYSDRDTVTKEVSVSGSTVKPVSEMKNEISTKVADLRTQANSSESMSTLTEVETQLSSIQTSWDKGNYAEAESKYDTALADLSSVEAQVSRQNNGGGNTGGRTDSPDNESSGGSGGGLIIFLLLLVIVLGAGFVVYTSYYPEEGDPLYDVLGDRE